MMPLSSSFLVSFGTFALLLGTCFVEGSSSGDDPLRPNGLCNITMPNTTCVQYRTSGYTGWPPCQGPPSGSTSGTCFIQCLVLNATECQYYSQGGGGGYDGCIYDNSTGSCYNNCSQFDNQQSDCSQTSLTGCTWRYMGAAQSGSVYKCVPACAAFASVAGVASSTQMWQTLGCPVASGLCRSEGANTCVEKCEPSPYNDYSCSGLCTNFGGSGENRVCVTQCSNFYDNNTCNALSACSWKERDITGCPTCDPMGCSFTCEYMSQNNLNGCTGLTQKHCMKFNNTCIQACNKRNDQNTCGNTECEWSSAKGTCAIRCGVMDGNSDQCGSLGGCQYDYIRNQCVISCSGISSNTTCMDYPSECMWSHGKCLTNCTGLYGSDKSSCVQRSGHCLWDESTGLCGISCTAYDSNTCPTDVCARSTYNCNNKCDGKGYTEAECILSKNLECEVVTNQSTGQNECKQRCSDFSTGDCQAAAGDYCFNRPTLGSSGSSSCRPICSMISEQWSCHDEDHCLWKGDSCVTSCYYRSSSQECLADPDFCRFESGKAGQVSGVCIPKCDAPAYQIAGACKGSELCYWDDLHMKCQYGDCNRMVQEFGWGSSEQGNCSVIPFCEVNNQSQSSSDMCSGSCASFTSAESCAFSARCYWSPSHFKCYAVCSSDNWRSSPHSPDFDCVSRKYYRSSTSIDDKEEVANCTQITDETVCNTRVDLMLACSWVNGKCTWGCNYRTTHVGGSDTQAAQAECTSDGHCQWQNDICVPKKCGGLSEASCLATTTCFWNSDVDGCAPLCSQNDDDECYAFETNSGECVTIDSKITNQIRYERECFPKCDALTLAQCQIVAGENMGCEVFNSSMCKTACSVYWGANCPSYCIANATTGFCDSPESNSAVPSTTSTEAGTTTTSMMITTADTGTTSTPSSTALPTEGNMLTTTTTAPDASTTTPGPAGAGSGSSSSANSPGDESGSDNANGNSNVTTTTADSEQTTTTTTSNAATSAAGGSTTTHVTSTTTDQMATTGMVVTTASTTTTAANDNPADQTTTVTTSTTTTSATVTTSTVTPSTTTTTKAPGDTTGTIVIARELTLGGVFQSDWLAGTKRVTLETSLKSDLSKALDVSVDAITITSLELGSLKVGYTVNTTKETEVNTINSKANNLVNTGSDSNGAQATFPSTYTFFVDEGGSSSEFAVVSSSAATNAAPVDNSSEGLSLTYIIIIAVGSVIVLIVVIGIIAKLVGGGSDRGTGFKDDTAEGGLLGENTYELQYKQ